LKTFLVVIPLVAHPDHAGRAIEFVTCSVAWRDAGYWAIEFVVAAPPAALKLPAAVPPERADGLWRATCFELFLRDPDDDSYLEFNFSPSGQWAAYHLDDYREGMRPLDVATPRILTSDSMQFASSMAVYMTGLGIEPEVARSLAGDGQTGEMAPDQFALCASLDDPRLPAGASWRIGLSAVIEEADGTISYWALAHPPGEPDFHHADCFALELPAETDV
jgi:hypothetical protein